MPTFDFVEMQANRARKDPLGPSTLNQLQRNAQAVDNLARIEHFADGQHNALEVPWVLGHLDDGATPTGYLFDTAFGGGTLARPATGAYTVDVAAGVVPTAVDGSTLLYGALGNVSDQAIEAKPHTITVEAVSATSFKWRVRELSSALGAGNSWADQNRDIDVGLHAPAQPADVTVLASYLDKQRRDFLTDQDTDWNALVRNQGSVRKAQLLEHTSAGRHLVNRIAKAAAWVRWNGASYVLDAEAGVASVTRVSAGVVELTMDDNFTSLNNMACFPEVQPFPYTEVAITNGRGFATGAGTSTFRFYTYVLSGGNWARADRSFFAPMFGVIA